MVKNNEIILNVDSPDTPRLEKLRDTLLKSANSTIVMENAIKRLNQNLANTQAILAKLPEGMKFAQALRELSQGAPSSAILNATTRGRIADINANDTVRNARELNAAFSALNQTVRSITNERRLAAAAAYTPGAINAAENAAAIRAQIQAVELRSAQLYRQAQASPRGMNAEFGAGYRQSLKDLEMLNAKLAEIQQREKQIVQVKSQSAKLSEQIAVKEAEIASARRNGGTALEQARLNIQRQELIIRKALADAEGKVNAQVKEQLRIRQQLRNELRQIEAQEKILNQRQARDNLVNSDSGASLFKVQASLLINYMLMNQVFKLMSFGRTYVIELDKTFRDLQAIIEATDTGMEGLKKTIIDVSQETRFSAVEVAKAAVIMGQAGLSLDQIDKSIRAVTMLATATGSDLTQSVEVSTSVLSVFNMRAEEMSHIANVLTGALNLSKLSIDKLALGIQYAGNIAADSGASLEELVAALGAISNAGIKSGSTMGTGLRQLLSEFLAPSDKLLKILNELDISVEKIDVRSQGMVQVFRNLTEAGFTTGEAFKALDLRAAASFAALTKNLDLADRMEQEFLLTSAALKANEVQMKSFSNTVDRFANILGVAINTGLGPMTAILRELMESLANVIQYMNNEMPWAISGLVTGFSVLIGIMTTRRLAGLVGELLFGKGITFETGMSRLKMTGGAIANLGSTIRAQGLATAATATATARLGSTLAALISPATMVGLAITAAAIGYGSWAANGDEAARTMDKLRSEFDANRGSLTETEERISSVTGSIGKLIDRYRALSENAGGLETAAIELRVKFGELGIKFDDNVTSVDGLIGALRKLRGEMRETAAEQAKLVQSSQALLLQQNAATLAQSGTPSLYSRINTTVGLSRAGIRPVLDSLPGLNQSLQSFSSVDYSSASKERLEELTGSAKELWAQLDQNIISVQKRMTEVTSALRNENMSYGGRRNAEATLKQLTALRDEQVKNRDLVKSQLQMITSMLALTEQTADAAAAATPVVGAAEAYVENLKLEISNLQASLTDANVSSEQKSENKRKIESLKKLLSTLTIESVIEGIARDFPELLSEAAGTSEGMIDALSRFLPQLQTQAQSIVTDTNNKAESIFNQLMQKHEEIVKKHDYLMAAAGRSAQMAADRLAVQSSYYDTVASSANDPQGGLRGKFNQAELLIMDQRKRQIDRQRMQAELTALAEQEKAISAAIGERQGSVVKLSRQESTDETKGKLLAERRALLDLEKKLADVRNELTKKTNELNAANGVRLEGEISLIEQLKASIENYQKVNLSMLGLENNIKELVDGTLDSAGSAFSTFFRSVSDGTKSVGSAFKDMARTIIGAMLDIVASEVAKQFLSLILGGVFKATGISIGGAGAPAPAAKNSGGMIRANMGRAITTRDSVPVLARPGEFILRNAAVDALGEDNLHALNAFGNRKVQSSLQAMGVAPEAEKEKTELNVWIVQEQSNASLGPNDVLAVVRGDILRGGATKKLIKQVMVE